jgi:hypothetical protein
LSARLIAFVLGTALFASACGPSDSDFSEFSTFVSPDDKYYVIIDSAHSTLAFGPETIRVYVVAKDTRVRNHVVTTKIANDGGGINDSNVKPKWIRADVIQICLSGVEQEDSVLKINLQTLSHSENKGNCS